MTRSERYCDILWNRERLATIFKYHRGHETILIRMLLVLHNRNFHRLSRSIFHCKSTILLRIQSIFFFLIKSGEDPGISCFETIVKLNKAPEAASKLWTIVRIILIIFYILCECYPNDVIKIFSMIKKSKGFYCSNNISRKCKKNKNFIVVKNRYVIIIRHTSPYIRVIYAVSKPRIDTNQCKQKLRV